LKKLIILYKNASKQCFEGNINTFINLENCFEKALINYKYCLEILDEIIHVNNFNTTKSTSLMNMDKSSKNSIDKKEETDKIINENSIIIEITNVNNTENINFENKDFFLNLELKLLHSIIYCCQKMYLFNDLIYYCNKILEIDNKDWVARLKRGLYYSFYQNKQMAEIDFALALEKCPNKVALEKELEKIRFN